MKYSCYFFLIIFFFTSCDGNSQEKKKKDPNVTEQLINMNQARVGNESKSIDDFVTKHNFKMQKTGSGLRLEIYEHGKNVKSNVKDTAKTLNPVAHDTVEVKYKLYFLNDKLVYDSDSTGFLYFRLGENMQPRGLEEALTQMIPGDKARLVVPSHLGYGLSGDQKKIPPGVSLYYDIELISINK